MGGLDVRTVRLEPMHVASVHAFGESPEPVAWRKLVAWATHQGLWDPPRRSRIFGFNEPNPSPGSPNYGYEFWMVVDAAQKLGADAELKAFPGGLYAVTRIQGVQRIHGAWHELARWCEDHSYQQGCHQWLEEHLGPIAEAVVQDQLEFDLYLPILD